MSYNQVNHESGVRVPAGAQTVSQGAIRDFQPGQPMSAPPSALQWHFVLL